MVLALGTMVTVLLPRLRPTTPKMKIALALLLTAQHARAACDGGGEWVDADTPPEACTSTSEFDQLELSLVFSDEFSTDGRTFADGGDPRWTALQLAPSTNEQVCWYNESLGVTRDGLLELISTSDDVDAPHFVMGPRGLEDKGARHLQTPMLQTWNKFCFQEGAADVRAKFPGRAEQAGLWPAFWLMGNLGRATLVGSTDGLWPFNFDECAEASADCEASQCTAQAISACDAAPGYGLNARQGRGAPEIDVIEVQPGSYEASYPRAGTGCPEASEEVKAAVAMRQPFVSTSLQAAPGHPHGSLERPQKGCVPTTITLPDGSTAAEWYPEMSIFAPGSEQSTAYQVGVNYEFWGDEYTEYMGGIGMQTDALSVNTALGATHWSDFHTYRVEWRSGADGFMRWSLDGELQFQLSGAAMRTPRPVHWADGREGTLLPREMPTEPMYLILNVDSSPKWGWPTHTNCTLEESLGCECCFDCKRLECTRCIVNGVNRHAWLADLCDDLPASYQVDWVRVYQPADAVKLGCDPPSHPTRLWIEGHEEGYVPPGGVVPLLAVVPGGGSCASDDDCGPGTCTDGGVCACGDGAVSNMTGPHCRSQAAGDALTCRPAELAARASDATCAPPTSYGVADLRTLRGLICTSELAGAETAAACAAANLTLGGALAPCSFFAQAAAAAAALHADTGGLACCNSIAHASDGSPLLGCGRGPSLVWLIALAAALAAAAALVVRWLATHRVLRRRRLPAKETVAPSPSDRDGAQSKAEGDAAVAAVLLEYSSAARRAERHRVCARLGALIGFQPANVANQEEHLESLLLSQLGRTRGDYIAAVDGLHASLLTPFHRWMLQNSSTGTNVQFGLADEDHRTAAWSTPHTAEQLNDVALYLLVWGEAANLRFMPELLYFLFATARAHCAAAAAMLPHPLGGGGGGGNAFLNRVVRPVYACVFDETFSGLAKGRPQPKAADQMPSHPKNYDDWNEAFWALRSLRQLRTAAGVVVVDAPPAARWALVLDADWRTFFRESPKTFREVRWWYGLLASNRRVYLVHAVGYAVCFFVAWPSSLRNAFNGWGALVFVPYLVLLPSLCRLGGCAFEWRFTEQPGGGDGGPWKRFQAAVLLLLLKIAALVALHYVQATMSLEAVLSGGTLRTWPIVTVGASTLVMVVAFAVTLVVELLPQRASSDAVDANLFWEVRAASLMRRSWCAPGSAWRPSAEVAAIVRMYAFWALVWAAKIAAGALVLLPATFDAHCSIMAWGETYDTWTPKTDVDAMEVEGAALSYSLDPASMIRVWLAAAVWGASMTAFVADTLLWYQLVMAVVGGVHGLSRHGLAGRWRGAQPSTINARVSRKLLGEDGSGGGWRPLWEAVVSEMHDGDLISHDEKDALLRSDDVASTQALPSHVPRNREARRRLQFLLRSLGDPTLPQSDGVLATPGLTVMVPHYAETILVPESTLTDDTKEAHRPLLAGVLSISGDASPFSPSSPDSGWSQLAVTMKKRLEESAYDGTRLGPSGRRTAHVAPPHAASPHPATPPTPQVPALASARVPDRVPPRRVPPLPRAQRRAGVEARRPRGVDAAVGEPSAADALPHPLGHDEEPPRLRAAAPGAAPEPGRGRPRSHPRLEVHPRRRAAALRRDAARRARRLRAHARRAPEAHDRLHRKGRGEVHRRAPEILLVPRRRDVRARRGDGAAAAAAADRAAGAPGAGQRQERQPEPRDRLFARSHHPGDRRQPGGLPGGVAQGGERAQGV